MRDRIIGPYFFAEKTVTANTYLDMLQLYAVPQLPDGAIFQQDGAPPHFANMVRTFLDEQFPARWIGRGSPYITWPARSPDLTPPDFFLWGFVKDQVYRTPVRDLADLQERIYAAVNNVTPQMLHNTWVEVEYRLDISRATNGSHVETIRNSAQLSSEICENENPKKRRKVEGIQTRVAAAKEVCDLIITQANTRFQFIDHLILSSLQYTMDIELEDEDVDVEVGFRTLFSTMNSCSSIYEETVGDTD
ncbi:hypothetical protein ANN_24490 [Periplaneta americana]|uniref:Transposable element Tc3 transposase n=1 Tax=Periplaneta americana TaxID=6978 RepID=A0ABQ8S392_PERAM|nr:hypothetical protein ANN_24490 [Periplaneta americana]